MREMQDQFRVIIAGSRSFSDYGILRSRCNFLFSQKKPTCILCGEARGADLLGRRYAEEHGIPVVSYPANWKVYGNRAGYIRNEKMAANADALVAFWDGRSSGTAHMIQLAREYGLSVRVIRFGHAEQ